VILCRFQMDPAWSETGDRYILKLFRDYLFHQVDENGVPWLDMAHIVQSLNKVCSVYIFLIVRERASSCPQNWPNSNRKSAV